VLLSRVIQSFCAGSKDNQMYIAGNGFKTAGVFFDLKVRVVGRWRGKVAWEVA